MAECQVGGGWVGVGLMEVGDRCETWRVSDGRKWVECREMPVQDLGGEAEK